MKTKTILTIGTVLFVFGMTLASLAQAGGGERCRIISQQIEAQKKPETVAEIKAQLTEAKTERDRVNLEMQMMQSIQKAKQLASRRTEKRGARGILARN